MRLIQTDGEGTVREVKTFDPIGGILDAVEIARSQGDGTYWVDSEEGQYYEFTLQDGETVHPLTEDGWHDGTPGHLIDEYNAEQRRESPASAMGGVFFDPDNPPAIHPDNFLAPQPAPSTEETATEVESPAGEPEASPDLGNAPEAPGQG